MPADLFRVDLQVHPVVVAFADRRPPRERPESGGPIRRASSPVTKSKNRVIAMRRPFPEETRTYLLSEAQDLYWNELEWENLTDEEGVTGAFPSSHWSYDTGVFENWYGNGNRQMITLPRTIGLTASYNF